MLLFDILKQVLQSYNFGEVVSLRRNLEEKIKSYRKVHGITAKTPGTVVLSGTAVL